MPRIAMIGAGSIVFCKTLMQDIMATEALADSEFVLMDPTEPKLRRMEAFATRMIKDNRLAAKVSATTDRRKALAGADYVIIMIQVGGVEAFGCDYKIPLEYGVDQCIGDSINPGGIFRALRTIPVLIDIARDMETLCPDAIMLNYANPMGMCCTALGKASKVKFIGLCHGVQTTMDLIARYVGVPKDEIDFLAAGINHMAWFLKLEHEGKDLNAVLRANIEKPEYYINEKVRGEVMRHLGYFMTESTGHLSEYLPWFRKNKKALDLYCDQPDFGGATGAYYKWAVQIAEKFEKADPLSIEDTALGRRSTEYCSYIIEAHRTGRIFKLNGNVRNDGYITNLPQGCCVEVPVYVDRMGLHPAVVGDLPPQCAAANMTNIIVQGLAVDAALAGDPELAASAVAFDPLTAAVCTLAEARAMTAEMLAAEAQWLPQFAGKKLRPTPEIKIPKDVTPIDVPLDPALAIVWRFMKLAQSAPKP
ncbi:MAG TPA: alpha-glucosidase/alpha-galactosidase [Planctomycetes bacterium]|nr:alpha-glucosidase/alpha-galactosidase [Planctomycetota bacterium]